MSNFISRSPYQKLGLKAKNINLKICGINQTVTSATENVEINIKSMYNAFSADLNYIVLEKVTENLPLFTINALSLQIPQHLKLADPKFYESRPVDLLIGAELFWRLLCVGQINNESLTIFQKTHFGWVAGGYYCENNNSANKCSKGSASVCHLTVSTKKIPLERQVEKFFELERCSGDTTCIENIVKLSNEEQKCEEHFQGSIARDREGRFVARLLFLNDKMKFVDSRRIALKQFYALERKLCKNQALRQSYTSFMKEYQDLNHMEVCSEPFEDSNCFYLPHHAVFKESSTTTKTRVVFNASSKASNGQSLNNNLMAGPVVQQDLFSILIRFRTFKYVINGDIAKMYRQIRIHPEDTKYQLIFWRDNPNDDLKTYRLTTLTYGTKPASFIATRCLNQLAIENESSFPLASAIIKRDFYMDDVLTGGNSIEEVVKIRDQIITILKQGCFELRKFRSNIPEILPTNNGDVNLVLQLNKDDFSKILGLSWNSTSDLLSYELKSDKIPTKITKRSILITTAQIFDPLGLVGPVVMIAKILLQKLWSLKIEWDESIPYNLQTTWISFLSELAWLREIKIPRNTVSSITSDIIELHGFCDASLQGYGAVIYLRSCSSAGNFETKLLCSKSRVAPIKAITMPRLELCGALLLARLFKSVQAALLTVLHIKQNFFWTDSSIVLAWLNTEPTKLETFVANRISEIQLLTSHKNWRHVKGEDNPADILSRGALPGKLIEESSWFYGPEFLKQPQYKWQQASTLNYNELAEKRIALTTQKYVVVEVPKLNQFSNYYRLQRVTAWFLRFIHNCKYKLNKRKIESKVEINDSVGLKPTNEIIGDDGLKVMNERRGNLSFIELHEATVYIVRIIQQQIFGTEIKILQGNDSLPKNSKLINLDPIMDDNNIIRVGGRLKNASIAGDVKHPILLPKHFVTDLIILQEHENNFHAGVQQTVASLRRRYWIINARRVVRRVLQKCIKCFRVKPCGVRPKMGDLPTHRVQPARPFVNSGVDFAGPMLIRESTGRGKRLIKAYIAVFVCFATKAIYLELVGSLTTESFLNALRRFISRRGHVQNLYSDNATNFVGANRELKEVNKFFQNKEWKDTLEHLNNKSINWHFIPAKSPHMGGIWECNVKSVKRHLKIIMGNANLTYEEFYTLLVRIEAVLNSRPLTPMTSDPNDFEVLTPAHFLIGEPLNTFNEHSLIELNINRLSRWKRVEQIRQHFWKRWSREYLSSLQARNQKSSDKPRIAIGSMVLIMDENLPPLQWKMGRIIATHPGSDDIVRVVTVKTNHGVFKRAVKKVCVLPLET